MTLLDHGVRELRETAVSVDEDAMRENDYGSILSTQGSIGAPNDEELMYQVGLIDGGLIACTKHSWLTVMSYTVLMTGYSALSMCLHLILLLPRKRSKAGLWTVERIACPLHELFVELMSYS